MDPPSTWARVQHWGAKALQTSNKRLEGSNTLLRNLLKGAVVSLREAPEPSITDNVPAPAIVADGGDLNLKPQVGRCILTC